MSFSIPTAHVQQYSANLSIKAQQLMSRLRSATMEGEVIGKRVYFDQIGKTVARKKTERHGKTPLISTDHFRRSANMEDLEWADIIERQDQVKILIDPKGKYIINGAGALNRGLDGDIIKAATGISLTGENGDIQTPLPASQILDVGLGAPGAFVTTGMNLEKLIAAKINLMGNEATENDEPLFIAMSATEIGELLLDPTITSSDFAAVKALQNGEIKEFMGFTFIRLQGLILDTVTGIRTCFAWAKSGLGLGIADDIFVDVGLRRDISVSMQVYLSLTSGATRIEEEKVVEIPSDTTPV